MTVPSGEKTGSQNSNPSGQCHPYCSELRLGGSGRKELFIIAAARCALRIF